MLRKSTIYCMKTGYCCLWELCNGWRFFYDNLFRAFSSFSFIIFYVFLFYKGLPNFIVLLQRQSSESECGSDLVRLLVVYQFQQISTSWTREKQHLVSCIVEEDPRTFPAQKPWQKGITVGGMIKYSKLLSVKCSLSSNCQQTSSSLLSGLHKIESGPRRKSC